MGRGRDTCREWTLRKILSRVLSLSLSLFPRGAGQHSTGQAKKQGGEDGGADKQKEKEREMEDDRRGRGGEGRGGRFSRSLVLLAH